jgi:Leu/Phe-tRNA-protein transferase
MTSYPSMTFFVSFGGKSMDGRRNEVSDIVLLELLSQLKKNKVNTIDMNFV